MSPSTPSRRDHPVRNRLPVTTSHHLQKTVAIASKPSMTSPFNIAKNVISLALSSTPLARLNQHLSTESMYSTPTKASITKTPSPELSPPPDAEIHSSPKRMSEQVQPVAGPSRLPSIAPSLIAHRMAKGKQRADRPKPIEKRVMPGRIRRAAGGGAEGIRDLEEMVVDWLDRWGEASPGPPNDLPIHITTLPMNLVYPPTHLTRALEQSSQASTRPLRLTSPLRQLHQTNLEEHKKIETPSWRIVKPGEDDKEEAREELAQSPVKRKIRHGHDLAFEDTSDMYYHTLHRKFEAFERKQRLREKEKLQFERYKMRTRIDLLRGLSLPGWTAVVNAVLSRHSTSAIEVDGQIDADKMREAKESREVDIWSKGRAKIKEKGIEWLRSRLVKEGEELVKRYDQLLPVEVRRPMKPDHRLSNPLSLTQTPSLSPPPYDEEPVKRAPRVDALREPPRKRRQSDPAPRPKKMDRRISILDSPLSTRSPQGLRRAPREGNLERRSSLRSRPAKDREVSTGSLNGNLADSHLVSKFTSQDTITDLDDHPYGVSQGLGDLVDRRVHADTMVDETGANDGMERPLVSITSDEALEMEGVEAQVVL